MMKNVSDGGGDAVGDIEDEDGVGGRARGACRTIGGLLDGPASSLPRSVRDGHHAISLRTGREFPKTKARPSDVSWRSEIAQEDAYKKSCGGPSSNGTNEVDANSNSKSSDPLVTGGPSSNPQELNELSANDKQEQNKLTKLFSMQDEFDRRYRQYYHQMHMVVSSFDVVVGEGASKPYTTLELLTISRHFRCLRDAISGQIRVLQKNLGDQDAADNNEAQRQGRLSFFPPLLEKKLSA
nr:BEL1-like homeodomain protein 7 [Ipomoea batatas]